MTAALDRQLYDATVLALEGLSFLLVEEEEVGEEPSPDEVTTASLGFDGPVHGVLHVSVGQELLETVAANMLGDDLPPSEAAQLDALGEVANVIGGNLLPMIGGEDAVFQIGAPVVAPGNPDCEPDATSVRVTQNVSFMEGCVCVVLCLAQGPSDGGVPA